MRSSLGGEGKVMCAEFAEGGIGIWGAVTGNSSNRTGKKPKGGGFHIADVLAQGKKKLILTQPL